MELYLRVRQACAAGMSQRQAAKAFNISSPTFELVNAWETNCLLQSPPFIRVEVLNSRTPAGEDPSI